MKTHVCCIDYGTMTCTVRARNKKIPLIIHSELPIGDILIPARAEIFRLFHINSNTFPVIIETQYFNENVIIPTTLAYSPNTWNRVLNATDDNVVVNSNNLKLNDISDYNIFEHFKSRRKINKFTQIQNHSTCSERLTRIMKRIFWSFLLRGRQTQCKQFLYSKTSSQRRNTNVH